MNLDNFNGITIKLSILFDNNDTLKLTGSIGQNILSLFVSVTLNIVVIKLDRKPNGYSIKINGFLKILVAFSYKA